MLQWFATASDGVHAGDGPTVIEILSQQANLARNPSVEPKQFQHTTMINGQK